ncbi:MAG: phenylalanine--tRNA ligase subunit beta [bacterium]
MKVTYNWLKSFVAFDYSPEELVQVLTMLGLEVDSLEHKKLSFDGLVVGLVRTKNPHSNSGKLWICEVGVGAENLSVVCGAPNVEIGQKVVVAPANSTLPDGTRIQRTQIRGVDSEGMLCSELELGISSRGDGIMTLDGKIKEGSRLQDIVGDGETVIDIDVTPNRPDCFGVMGVAREIAAVSGQKFKKPSVRLNENGHDINNLIKINVLDQEKCPRYSARFVRQVEIRPSPWWLAHRLESIGVRSINNVVDATNYVMMETGQPLHAFDYSLLSGQEINVKTAESGENFTTLDNVEHSLNPENLMICDAERSIAIGGVMGGLNSEVSSKTTEVLLESAHFNPVNIRRTSKGLGLTTEASKRFERGVDPNGTLYALERAAKMIADLAQGQIAQGSADVYPSKIAPLKLKLRKPRVSLLIGKNIPGQEMKAILSNLSFEVSEKEPDTFDVSVPTFRPDVTREVDLIEEIARVHGYDNIAPDSAATINPLIQHEESVDDWKKITHYLVSLGLSQVVTYCLIGKIYAERFSSNGLIALTNPISEDLSYLRPSLIPGLLNVVRGNINRRNPDLRLFEIGTVFNKSGDKINEHPRLTAVFTGQAFQNNWKRKSSNVDIYDVKGYVSHLFTRHCRTGWSFQAERSPFTDPERTLGINADGRTVGYIGEIAHEFLDDFDIQQRVYVFDMELENIFTEKRVKQDFLQIPKFPPIIRDLAIVVDEKIDSENLLKEIWNNGGDFLHNVELFDMFTGKQVEKGFKSLAYELTFYSTERTLIDQEVDARITAILAALATQFGARLRD